MGWDSERLRKLPKVTKLGKAPEPQADPAPEAGLLMAVFDSPCLSQTRAPRQGSPAAFWLRTLAEGAAGLSDKADTCVPAWMEA